MAEEYGIYKEAPLFVQDPQDELYGRQRKYKILTRDELETLCEKAICANLISFSDNTLESIHVFDLIIKFSNLLHRMVC